MSDHKSQKGRTSAAQQFGDIERKKRGAKSRFKGAQQFGGVAQEMDKGSEHLSGRAERALGNQNQGKTKPSKKAA